jgi:D-glycero-alpha-D-manno-heptose-7-phosphate kinase
MRLTLAGGGTDAPDFVRRHGAQILGVTIDRFVQVTIAADNLERFDIRSNFPNSCGAAAEVADPLTREALSSLQPTVGGLRIGVVEDVPIGAGGASSTAYLLALLAGIAAIGGKAFDAEDLARRAVEIEVERLNGGGGVQDQYLVAVGGLTLLQLHPDGRVDHAPFDCAPSTVVELESRLRLYWAGGARQSSRLLRPGTDRRQRLRRHQALEEIAVIGRESVAALRRGAVDVWGTLLHDHWVAKQAYVPNDFDPVLYRDLREQGVVGAKLMGAGGTGLVLLCCGGFDVDRVMTEHGYDALPFSFWPRGVEVMGITGRPVDQ